jgi:4-hydroxymandelate oxidase
MKRREILQTLSALVGTAAVTGRIEANPSTTTPSPKNATSPHSAQGTDDKLSAAPVNLFEYEDIARQRLPQMVFDFVAGAAGDELTLHRNRTQYDAIRLKPRVLRDVSLLDTRLELFGQKMDFPILLAPTAYHKLIHPQGEAATARGAGSAGATLVVSSFSTVAIEDVGKAATGRLWFQLYVQEDRGFTKELVQRAEAAGCQAITITVDTPVIGIRNREQRDQFKLPSNLHLENLKNFMGNAQHFVPGVGDASIFAPILDPKLTWEGVDWVRSFAKVPVLLKGILTPEDAKLAVDHGVSGILCSNHGARNLDTLPATIEALPGVIEAVQGRIPVLVDGGIRRGTDVVKALAFGAKAVLIGRSYLWGLATNGSEGVAQVVRTLRTEFLAAMALCGTPSLAKIDRNVIWPER